MSIARKRSDDGGHLDCGGKVQRRQRFGTESRNRGRAARSSRQERRGASLPAAVQDGHLGSKTHCSELPLRRSPHSLPRLTND